MRRSSALCAGGLDLLACRCRSRTLAEAREEEGLVDATIEDRDTELEAFGDHVTTLESRLSCQLRGRQVIGHRCCSSFAGITWPEVCPLGRMGSRGAGAPRPAVANWVDRGVAQPGSAHRSGR